MIGSLLVCMALVQPMRIIPADDHLSAQLKRPCITIPQGQIESGLDPKARGRAGEKGAWQVIEKHHGKVPRKLVDQGKQAERILDDLLTCSNGDMMVALRKYNGAGPKARKYAKMVRRRAIEYHLIG